MHAAEEAPAHLDGRSRQDDSEICGQLLDGFGKFGFAVFDHVTLVEDAVIKFDVPAKAEAAGQVLKPPPPLELEALGQYTPEKVDVVPHDVVRRHYQVVLLHLVLQPGSKEKTVGAFQPSHGRKRPRAPRASPHSFRGRSGVVQRVQVLFGAELADLVDPVSCERGRTHHQRRHGAAVWGFSFGVLLRPEHRHQESTRTEVPGGRATPDYWHYYYPPITGGFKLINTIIFQQ